MLRLINSLFGLLADAKSSCCEEEQTLIDMNILQIHREAVSQQFIYSNPAVELGTTWVTEM